MENLVGLGCYGESGVCGRPKSISSLRVLAKETSRF